MITASCIQPSTPNNHARGKLTSILSCRACQLNLAQNAQQIQHEVPQEASHASSSVVDKCHARLQHPMSNVSVLSTTTVAAAAADYTAAGRKAAPVSRSPAPPASAAARSPLSNAATKNALNCSWYCAAVYQVLSLPECTLRDCLHP